MKALNKILTKSTTNIVKNVGRINRSVDGLLDRFEGFKGRIDQLNSNINQGVSNLPGPLQDAASNAASNVTGVLDQASNAVDNVTDQAQGAVGNVTSQVQETAEGLANRALSEGQEIANTLINKEQLLGIVKVKNQLQLGLTGIYNAFSKINNVGIKTEDAINVLNVLILVIKNLPLPTSIPPGIGVPVNLITKLTDVLEKSKDFIEKSQDDLKMIPPLANFLTSATLAILAKLQELDILLNMATAFLTKDMTQAEKNEFIGEIGNVAATAGDFNNEILNVEDEQNLEESLSFNSSDPYLYRKTDFPTADWRFIVEHNQDNPFDFPQRRIKIQNINDDESNIYRGVVVYGPINDGWSYSNSVKVLIEEAKFTVEGLNNIYWARANRNYTPN